MIRKLLVALASPALLGAGSRVIVEFREVDTVFANPGKGWMGGRAPRENPRFPVSVAYIRLNWGDIEPEKGRYQWQLLDEPVSLWKRRGATLSLRIMTANAHTKGYYCSPKWLFDAGCRSSEFLRGGDDPTDGGARIPRIEPDYSDPLYLAEHARFIRELGKRYDGHPSMEFLDIGSYGIWGEWHTKNPAPPEVRRKIVDMYVEAFKRTPLVMMSDDAELLDYALSRGTGLRRDGVGSVWHEKNWIGSEKYKNVRGFADAWKRAPVVLEWYGNYEYFLRRQWPFDRAVQFMLDNHVSLINDNIGQVPPEQMPALMKLARLSGYRFVLRRLEHAAAVRRGERLDAKMHWSNVGVARLYREFPLELYLLDAGGRIVHRQRTDADARAWLPGDHEITARIGVPKQIKAGEYSLGLAFVDTEGRPAIALAIDAPAAGRLYRLSKVAVQ